METTASSTRGSPSLCCKAGLEHPAQCSASRLALNRSSKPKRPAARGTRSGGSGGSSSSNTRCKLDEPPCCAPGCEPMSGQLRGHDAACNRPGMQHEEIAATGMLARCLPRGCLCSCQAAGNAQLWPPAPVRPTGRGPAARRWFAGQRGRRLTRQRGRWLTGRACASSALDPSRNGRGTLWGHGAL